MIFACAFSTWWQFSTGDILAWHIEQLDVHVSGTFFGAYVSVRFSTSVLVLPTSRILFFLQCPYSRILWVYMYSRAPVAKNEEKGGCI